MKKTQWIIGVLVAVLLAAVVALYRHNLERLLSRQRTGESAGIENYSGTQSCRECHEKFYKLWAPSHHGLAMQPFTAGAVPDGS